MSQPEDAEPVGTTDGEDAQLLLADPDDYHRAQRLREIHKARRKANQARREAQDKFNDVRHTHRRNHRAAHVAKHVHQYAVELEPLIRATDGTAQWRDELPWDTFDDYMDRLGYVKHNSPAALGDKEKGRTYPPMTEYTIKVMRWLNRRLADIEPIIQEDKNDSWEI